MPLKPQYPWNVLIFPAASEIGLEVHRSLRGLKEVVLHGANIPGPSVADQHFTRLHTLPTVYEADCLPQLQKLIATHKIDAIIPAHDDVVVWLAQNAMHLNASIITSPLATCETCRSKKKTYATMFGSLPVPRLWETTDSGIEFPVFVKPDKGHGSRRARLINDRATLLQTMMEEPDLIIMENLPGREYTVDCFSQKDRGILFMQGRERIQTRTGITTLSHFVNKPEIRTWAQHITSKLDLRGAWFFQMKEDRKGQLRLLEIAPRVAGSMSLSRFTGPNFSLLSLYEAAGIPLNIDRFEGDLVLGRSLDVQLTYDKPIGALYVDLDHALLLRDQVNTGLVALIFQCRNRNIPVHLITRHKGNLAETLTKFRLDKLFDRIIHIIDDTIPKNQYMTELNAILIDDSFGERRLAHKAGIRCFDVAAAVHLVENKD